MSNSMLNHAFVLASRPDATPAGPHNFKLVSQAIAPLQEGEVLVKHHYLSLDPYMRGRMNESRSYAAAQNINETMIGGTVGEVVESKLAGFSAGDLVVGMGGWQLYSIAKKGEIKKVPASTIPLQAYLGVLGMPGTTAWVGLNNIIHIKEGETLVVSAATGPVGAVTGQLAKRAGARVVGIAGGKDKCAYAVEELGFDVCVDHKADDFKEAFKAATPKGVDGCFENVGGLPFQLALRRANPHARYAICGLVASGYDGTPTPIPDMSILLAMRIKIQGFIVSDDMSLWPKAAAELAPLVASGAMKWRETVAEGLEAAPEAFFGMLKGKNFGKQLVKLL
jgi:NADPH-dependent curcumin reductase